MNKASGIFNGNWKGGIYQDYLRDMQSGGQIEVELTPDQEIEKLQELIVEAIARRSAFRSNAFVVRTCNETIRHCNDEILEWRTAIEVEGWFEQTAKLFGLLRSGEYPADLAVARRAAFVAQVQKAVG